VQLARSKFHTTAKYQAMYRLNSISYTVSRMILVTLLVNSCSKSSIPATQQGNWVTKSSFNGPNRSEAVVFVIGVHAYVATGIDQTNKRYNDLWSYDPVLDNWIQLANMPDTSRLGASTMRSSAVAFSVGAKGYVGTGYNGFTPMRDFWEYDSASNMWRQIADFGGSARYDAVAFGILNFGYVSTGYDGANAQKDFWQYDPSVDAWTQKVSMGGDKRSAAVAFVYQDKGYITTGINSGTLTTDFWEFDPSKTEGTSWKQLRHINNYSTDTYDDAYTYIARSNAAAFVIGDSVFISTGNNITLYQYTYGYSFQNDLWIQRTSYEGAPREGAIGFSVNGGGYIALGRSSSAVFDDLREFFPNEIYNPND
jgi:N-acetylneuraminic acid mutarotase